MIMEKVWFWIAGGSATVGMTLLGVWLRIGYAHHASKVQDLRVDISTKMQDLRTRISSIETGRAENAERLASLEKGQHDISSWLRNIDDKLNRLIERQIPTWDGHDRRRRSGGDGS